MDDDGDFTSVFSSDTLCCATTSIFSIDVDKDALAGVIGGSCSDFSSELGIWLSDPAGCSEELHFIDI